MWADTVVYSTGFESTTTGTQYQSTATCTSYAGNGASWSIYYGNFTTDAVISGSKGAQMRLYKDGKCGTLTQTSDIANVDSVRFAYKCSNANVRFKVQYSTNGGSTWTDWETGLGGNTTTSYFKEKLATRASTFRLKIVVTGGHPSSSNRKLTIDDIVYKTVSECNDPATALSVSAAATTIFAGVQTQLSTSGGNGSNITYSVTSANSTYATIDGSNKFSATQAGTYTVQASQDEDGGTCGGTATVNITVRYQVKWSVNGNDSYTTGSPTTYIGTHDTKVATLPTSPASGLCDGSKVFVGWTATPIVGTTNTIPTDLFTTAAGSPNVTDNVTYYAVFATVGTATFQASDITNTPATGNTREWGHTASGTLLYLSAGQYYTGGTPYTWTVTAGTSNYARFTAGSGKTITQIVVTISGTNYKINSVTEGTLSTSSTTQTITGINNSTVDCKATSSYQIRITQAVVTYASAFATSCCTALGSINGSVSMGSTSATLTWDNIANVSSWAVTCKNTSTSTAEGTVGSITTNGSGKKTCTITNLTCGGTGYTFTISATAASDYCDKTWELTGSTTACTDPAITVSPTSLTGLNYIVDAGPSTAQDITLGGSYLTGNLTVTAPTNFEVSIDGGSSYGNSKTVTVTSGSPTVSTIKVRMKPGLAVGNYGSASTYVTVSGGGATTQNVSVQGSVLKPTITASPTSISWNTAVGVAPTTQSVTVTGTHLKGAISAALNGTDASSFSISTSSIDKATAEGAGGTITITYTGSYAATTTKTANIALTASDATTVNVPITFNVITDPNLYFLTNLEDIGPKDKVIIVSYKDAGGLAEEDRALPSYPTYTDPSSVDVKDLISANRQTLSYSETALQWNIVYNSTTGQFTANQYGEDDVKLACKDDNAGVQLGTMYTNTTFTLETVKISGTDYLYIKNIETGRYLGIYNSNSWRCYNPLNSNIYNQDIAFYVQKSTDPYVMLSSSFTEFTYEYTHGPSVAQSFTVSGANLSANLVVSAPTNYEVCKTEGGTYTSSVSFTPSTGTVSEQTVYIRLAAGKAVGEYNYAKADGLAVTSTGADDVKAALTGSVTPQSFTVTATSSDVNHGTVSPASQNTTTNMTITASPVDGYRVVSGAGGYTVTAGTASVTNNGDNTFTVTPSTDCTVQINFEAIPTHKVRYWASGTIVQESDVCEGAAIPDQTAETAGEIEAYCNNREHFVGWTTNSAYSHATDAPDGMITTMSPGGTMSTIDVNYYAVFANTGGASTSFSRVTNLSQLADGDVIAIVAEQSGGQIFSTSADHKGGSAPTETDGKITVSASTNQWTLKASDTSWKLHKGDNNADILCADLTYSASGNAMSIVDAKTSNYFFIKSSSKALEYYNSKWQFYSISNPVTDTQNGNVRLKIYKQDAGYVDYTTQCCALKPVTGVEVSSSTGTSVTLRWTLPASIDGITKFQIIDVDNANNVVTDGISTSATSATVSGLIECNTYHYKVVSYSAECTVSSATVEAQPFGGAKTVTFNYNGGTGTPVSFTTSCGNLSTTLPAATQDGYTFLGWWTAADGGSKVGDAEAEYPVSTTTTIHAHWAQNFTVTYDRVGGTDVCANETCGAGMTYTVCGTEPTKSGYIFAGWKDASTSVVYNAGDNFTMPAADVTLTAQWTANWRNLTFNVPSGGGSITGGPSGNHVLDNRTFTFPNITGKSDAKWCWTFLGWTETAPNGSGTWATTPSYIAGGATSGAITSDKTYYAVYSKIGAGASGDVYLTNEIITAKWADSGNAYGNATTITAGGEWTYTGYGQKNNTYLQLKDGISSIYLKTPAAAGNITTITINYVAVSSDTRTIYCNTSNSTKDAVTNKFDGTYSSGNHDVEIDVSSLASTSIYIGCDANIKFNSLSFHYGPAAIYGYTLDDCPCVVEEFDLTYDANATTFPGSTTTCTGVTDYRWDEHDNEYTICSTVPTLEGYKFTHWATNANGSGTTYNAGEVISCVGETPITLYAQYERVYTVTFNNQGTITPVTQASAGASVVVPSATSPCSGEWAFVGWSETAIAPMSFLPTLEIAAGEGTYTPTADKTLYAIYRKTSESLPFVAGMSGAYKISNGGDVYAGAYNSSKLPEADAAGAEVFYIKYTATDGGKYTIQRSDGKYITYSGSSTSLGISDDVYYWTMDKNGNMWRVQSETPGRYLQHDAGYGFRAYTGSNTDLAFTATNATFYYRTMSCEDEFDITFHNNGTTINWAGGYPEAAYKGLADATVISTFPTATFDGWTFIGWRQADYKESTDAPASSSVFGGSNGTSGNKLTIASANVDLYPVFTRFEDNEPFDQINGGDYYIYFLESGSDDGYGGEKRVYAATHDGIRYNSTAVCDNATTFTFTKLDNGNWTIYDNTTKKYLYGVADDDLRQKASATGAEWTLTVNGNQFDAFHVGTSYGQITAFGNGTSATFMNYRRTNIGSIASYHRVYLGSCTNRTFTTNPSTTPNIELHGQVKVTSTAGKSIKSTSVLTVSASNIATANLTVTSNNSTFKLSLTSNGTYSASVNIPVVSNKVGVTPIYVEYTPTATEDGIEETTITVSDGDVTPTEVSTESGDVQGRHVPANFVIAAKWGDKWYALPANCTESTSSTTGVLIEVDNASDPTRATAAPSYTKWGLQTVRPSRKAEYGTRLVFTEQLTTATADDQKTLYNGSTTSIQANAMYKNYMDVAAEKYEWIPTTTDLKDYILTSATTLSGDASARTVSLSNKGVFGTLLINKSNDGKVRILPADFYEPVEMQVIEWKANSLVVMYGGSGIKATTQVGNNDPSSLQTLVSAKVDHGVYELSTSQALTNSTNMPLTIAVKNGSDVTTGTCALIVPAIVTGAQDAPLGLTADEATLTDVVVTDGATLSAVATKYTFKNITVYPGGKLVIGSGKQLGMASLTLRGGSSWGAATYEHKYPQFVVNNTASGAYSNTSGVINYDYVTTKDQYYSFVLPYAGNTGTIKYPVDIYGRALESGSQASFEFQYYDGAARAAGGTGWKVLAEPATLVAGTGYTFLGMPRKVDAYDGTDDSHANTRQRYGIHRIPMGVAANAVQAGETGGGEPANKPISINVTLASKNNNSGWALVGNPYLSNVSGLDNTDIQVGKLVHTDTNPWDGKWQWDNPTTGVRYIVTTDDGQNFESQQASTATLKAFKNFFVQIQNGEATSLVIPANLRTDKNLAPARYMADVEQDIQLAVDLVSETRSDKVDLLINDIYTAEFDQDGDFTKMMNTTNFNLYGVYPGDNLSFIAVDKTTAAGSIAIGYQVPAAGEYTLQLSERPYVMSDYVETLLVTDHEVSPEVTTDLLENPYSFTVTKAETNDARFTVSIKLKENQDTPTDIDIINGGGDLNGEKPIKFIYHDKMYILRNGVLYDATGKKVREINK